jgi:carboxymethylenebutenolidase
MKIQTDEYEATAYFALPKSGQGPGVLVLHPWWGLNDDVKAVCDRLAEAGFVALAPDLYDGRIATTIPEAEEFSQTMDEEAAEALVRAAVDELLADEACRGEKIGVIGFSMGAMFAVWIAHDKPNQVSAVVLFYGVGWANQTNTQASYLGHFAENDPYEEEEYQISFKEKLEENGRPSTFHIYPNTGHWFFEPSRTDAYNETASELAWKRTVSFLKETLN